MNYWAYMNHPLNHQKCKPCEGIGDKLSKKEIKNLSKQVRGWNLSKKNYLTKAFLFKNFKDALAFTNSIGKLAEKEGHHPDIKFGWGYVEINLTTHALKGLSMNDFIMASKINTLRKK